MYVGACSVLVPDIAIVTVIRADARHQDRGPVSLRAGIVPLHGIDIRPPPAMQIRRGC